MEDADGEGSGCTAQDQYTSGMVWTRTRRAFQYEPGEAQYGNMVRYGGFGTYKGSGAPCSKGIRSSIKNAQGSTAIIGTSKLTPVLCTLDSFSSGQGDWVDLVFDLKKQRLIFYGGYESIPRYYRSIAILGPPLAPSLSSSPAGMWV